MLGLVQQQVLCSIYKWCKCEAWRRGDGLCATNNGVTALIDHQGRIIKQIPQFQRDILRGDVPSYVGHTPYMVLGALSHVGVFFGADFLGIMAKKMKNTTAKREKFYTADGVVDR